MLGFQPFDWSIFVTCRAIAKSEKTPAQIGSACLDIDPVFCGGPRTNCLRWYLIFGLQNRKIVEFDPFRADFNDTRKQAYPTRFYSSGMGNRVYFFTQKSSSDHISIKSELGDNMLKVQTYLKKE